MMQKNLTNDKFFDRFEKNVFVIENDNKILDINPNKTNLFGRITLFPTQYLID